MLWLTLNGIAALFDVDKSVVSRHLSNIYADKELVETATVANYATVQTEGSRQVTRNLDYYNLEAIIAVGYRVNSRQGEGGVVEVDRRHRGGGWFLVDGCWLMVAW